MVLAGNKAKRFSSVNHITKKNYHYHPLLPTQIRVKASLSCLRQNEITGWPTNPMTWQWWFHWIPFRLKAEVQKLLAIRHCFSIAITAASYFTLLPHKSGQFPSWEKPISYKPINVTISGKLFRKDMLRQNYILIRRTPVLKLVEEHHMETKITIEKVYPKQLFPGF